MVLGDPLHLSAIELDMGSLAEPESFTAFVSSRCIAYVLSPDELGQLQVEYRNHGCNCYSSGEALSSECILPSGWPHMLSWLDKVHKDPEYAEQVIVMGSDMDDEMRQAMEGLKMPVEEDDHQQGRKGAESSIAVKEEPKADDVMEGAGAFIKEAVKQEEIEKDIKPAVMEDAEVRMEDIDEEVKEEVKTAKGRGGYEDSDDGYSGDVEEARYEGDSSVGGAETP